MGCTLFLIGTSHQYQSGLLNAPNHCYEEFKELIRHSVRNNSVSTIGEELSESVDDKISSLSKAVAEEQNIAHIFCDPTIDERRALGLPEKDDPSTWAGRENEWLNRLQNQQFPVLFVCGADHVDSFAGRCRNNEIAVEILVRDWEPKSEAPLEFRML